MSLATSERPVFLHSLWRTGSTYVFGRFRETQQYYCLYEPLHELLERIDERMMADYSSSQIANNLNHSQMSQGYFEEYRPLLRTKTPGLAGYRDSMAIAHFFNQEHTSLHDYVEQLIAECHAQQRQPLLQFCRSSGRMGIFRRCFTGTNVYLQRNPRDQWQSYLTGELPYYLPLTAAIASLHETHSARLSSILTRPLPPARAFFGWFRRRPFGRTLRAAQQYDRELDDADRYRIFYADWLRAAGEARRYCDLTIDINRISHDTKARRDVEKTFSIQLDDCRIKEYEEHRLPANRMQEIEQQVTELFE